MELSRANSAGSFTGLPSATVLSDGYLAGASYFPKNYKPQRGEKTGAQNTNYGVPYPIADGLAGNPFASYPSAGLQSMFAGAYPGLAVNIAGAGLFGFGANGLIQPRKGSFGTYRLMALHPLLKLIYTLITTPIITSQWTIKPANDKKDVPQQWQDMVKEQILPLRKSILREALRYLYFGYRPFEKVWDIQKQNGKSQYVLKKLKPLIPDWSVILHDGFGNYAGLQAAQASQLLAPNESWICSHDVEAGNLYGLSRFEAAFDPWIDWQYARLRAAMLAGKLSGTLPILYYRPGTTLINGVDTDNSSIAKQILASIGLGNGAAVPTSDYTDDEMQSNPALAKLTPWQLEIVNAGTYAPAVDGIIHEREYIDKNLCRAMGWPERAVIEAQHGGIGSGDAKEHGDAAALDREAIDDDLADQISIGQPNYDVPGVIDDILELNAGKEWRGSLKIQPAPLVDEKVAIYTQILNTAMANPQLATILSTIPDWDDLFNHLDIATPQEVKGKINEIIKTGLDEQNKQQQQAAQQKQQMAADAMKQAGLAGKSNQVNVPRQLTKSNDNGKTNGGA